MQIPELLNCLIKEDIEKDLDKEDHIVVYCADVSCNNSIRLYQLLESWGYKNITRFARGLQEWDSEGFPLVDPK